MEKKLKKALLVGVAVFVVVAVASIVVGYVSADGEDNLAFVEEKNPKLIGSYLSIYENGSFDDYDRDEWSSWIHLFLDFEKCIVPSKDKNYIFFSDWERGWYWMPRQNIWGDICYRLEKNK